MFKSHISCRVCGNEKLKPYLNLGLMPLSNNLLSAPDEIAPRYPLEVLLCERCGLSQLSTVIDPVTLFGHYVYRSSMSEGYKKHCHDMALDLRDQYDLDAETFHIDIAGNDGALLAEFKKVLGHKTLNIDPAVNLIKICEDQGIRVYNTFWGMAAAKHLLATSWPLPKLITATNVFAHVDDVTEFLDAIKSVLRSDGVAIIEFPYLIDFIEKNEFDTVYFEHLSYFSIYPLSVLCGQRGLVLTDVTHHDIHGGSVRCHIRKHGEPSTNVKRYVFKELEEGYNKIETYKNWAAKVDHVVRNFSKLITYSAGTDFKIYAFAASAKGNTLLNVARLTADDIPFIIDQTPEKIGKYSPGTGIPIVSLDRLVEDQPDFLVLLAWNFAEEIIEKCKAAGYKGRYILPLTCEVI